VKIVEVVQEKAAEDTRDLFKGGKVYLQSLVSKDDTEQFAAAMVHFDAGARTKLHIHEFDQILYATKGKGLVGTDKEQHLVGPDTLVFIPGGEPHFHGASDDESFSHLAVSKIGKMQILE
jgi:quercetin dioxygenase-like cupin family protein